MRVELNVKYFSHDDLPFLNDWLRSRKKSTYEICDLPAVGFVISEGDYRIATCFLRRCEGNYGIVDGLCSNPEAAPELRHAALDVAIKMACEEAKQREISHLIAWTIDGSVLERSCERHGFAKSDHALLTKDLTEDKILDS